MNILNKTTQFVHYILKSYISNNSIAVDCTVGNGNDTLFLAKNCHYVFGFDIQNKAIETTDYLLKQNGCNNYKLYLDSHSQIDKYIKQKVDIIVFNLGYLPKADKSITTNYDTTIKALDSCLNLMSDNGVIAITIYYGHQQGKTEREALLNYLDQIDQKKYMVRYISTLNSDKCPPEVVFITQKGKQIII